MADNMNIYDIANVYLAIVSNDIVTVGKLNYCQQGQEEYLKYQHHKSTC